MNGLNGALVWEILRKNILEHSCNNMQHWPFLSAGDCRYSRKLKDNLGKLHNMYHTHHTYHTIMFWAWPSLTRLDQVSDAHAYLQVPVFLRWEVENGTRRSRISVKSVQAKLLKFTAWFVLQLCDCRKINMTPEPEHQQTTLMRFLQFLKFAFSLVTRQRSTT